MAGLNYPETGSLALVILFIAKSLAALNDCPRLQYFNGSQCAPCSGCPPGFGQKTKCTSKEDTECEACYPGFDYSNTSGYEPCILAHSQLEEMERAELAKSESLQKVYLSARKKDGESYNTYKSSSQKHNSRTRSIFAKPRPKSLSKLTKHLRC